MFTCLHRVCPFPVRGRDWSGQCRECLLHFVLHLVGEEGAVRGEIARRGGGFEWWVLLTDNLVQSIPTVTSHLTNTLSVFRLAQEGPVPKRSTVYSCDTATTAAWRPCWTTSAMSSMRSRWVECKSSLNGNGDCWHLPKNREFCVL